MWGLVTGQKPGVSPSGQKPEPAPFSHFPDDEVRNPTTFEAKAWASSGVTFGSGIAIANNARPRCVTHGVPRCL